MEMTAYTSVGTYDARVDSLPKATGELKYINDMCIPGMLHAKVLRSTEAHAAIVKVDVSEALAMPGVVAAITGEQAGFSYGRQIEDEPIIARGRVRYIGEPVAAVAAVDEAAAEAALERIKVNYQPLPAIFDAEQAAAADALLVHPDLMSYKRGPGLNPGAGTNVCNSFKIRRGDLEAAFAQADFVFEHRFTTPPIQHCPIETCGAIAYSEASGQLTVWSGTQGPHLLKQLLCKTFGLPGGKVRVIQPPYGGGFGGKVPMHVEPIAVALSMQCHMPVRLALNREEEFAASTVRHGSIVRVKSGVTKDGRITARKVDYILDTGAYARIGPLVLRNSAIAATGPYDISNVQVDGVCVYTNKVPAGALRGFGTPQVSFAYESHMDMIAHELGIDPVKFRVLNIQRSGSINGPGETVKDIAIERCIEEAASAIGWGEPDIRSSAAGAPYLKRGKGVASVVKACAGPAQSIVVVRVAKDSSASILISASDMGQGVEMVVSQAVAETLGIPLGGIRVEQPDTSYSPFDELTTASKATFHTGNAARSAALDIAGQLVDMAATELGAEASALAYSDGAVRSADGSVCLRIADILGKGRYRSCSELLGRGMFISDYVIATDPETGQSPSPVAFWMYAAQAVEVEVDTQTGHVRVLRVAAAHDVGQAITRIGCEQQIQGGVVFALGQSLWEETMIRDGRVANPTLLDYKILTSADTPQIIPIIIEDAPHPLGPFGAKGLGEIVTTPTAPAVANAVFDATGARVCDLPLTPERVLGAIKAVRNGGKAVWAVTRLGERASMTLRRR